MLMEKIYGPKALAERAAKEHLENCLNLLDYGDTSGAVSSIEQAVHLQPDNAIYSEIHTAIKRRFSDLQDPMSDRCNRPSPSFTATGNSGKHHFDQPKVSGSMNEQDDFESSIPGNITSKCSTASTDGTTDHTDVKDPDTCRTINPCVHCLQCHPDCEEKNVGTSGISMEEKTQFKFDTEQTESATSGDINHQISDDEMSDVDARFLEEVCKERESTDGWDTYFKLLSESMKSEVDDDIKVRDQNAPNQNFSVSKNDNSASECNKNTTKEQKSSTCNMDKNSSPKKTVEANSASQLNNSTEFKKEGKKETLFFRNGSAFYGFPTTKVNFCEKTQNEEPRKKNVTEPMDQSETDFYKNLRVYFRSEETKEKHLQSLRKKNEMSAKPMPPSSRKTFTSFVTPEVESSVHVPGDIRNEHVPPQNECPDSVQRPSFVSEENCNASANTTTSDRAEKHEEHRHKKKSQHVDRDFTKTHSKDEKLLSSEKTSSTRKRTKKVHRNRAGLSPDREEVEQSSKSRSKSSAKPKLQSVPEIEKSNRKVYKEKPSRPLPKEEMIKKISGNDNLERMKVWMLKEGKEICHGLIWILLYALAILAVLSFCAGNWLFNLARACSTYIMSLRIAMSAKDKVLLFQSWCYEWYTSCKTRLLRWYYALRTINFREKIFGPKRQAQTYNLPNSGEDAIRQLLEKKYTANDPYSILGVPTEASDDDIRKQYRKLAVLVHPDKNLHPDTAEAFQILTNAYDVIGDPGKREQYDIEAKRRQSSQTCRENPQNFTDPFAFFMQQMEEIRESLSCDVCQNRHRRVLTDRSVLRARRCYVCNTMHQAKEGDFWKETTFLGILGKSKFYTRMDGNIYDITKWGLCQERSGFDLPADSHRVAGRINSRRPKPPPRFEEKMWRDIFGQQDQYHGNENNQRTGKQRRRRKRK